MSPNVVMPSVDAGFVFAMPQEAAGVFDRLKRHQTTYGNGWTFHTGDFDRIRVAAVLSGIGQKNAEAAANVLIDVFAPKIVCSAGYAGGLSKRLKQYNVCFPEQVIRESDGQTLDLTVPVPQKVQPLPNKLTLITVNEVIESPEEKQRLNDLHGAELVDMETFAIAEVCRIREIPFLSVRIILDTVGEQIPKEITKIAKNVKKGMFRLTGTILGTVWSRPSVVLDLVSLKKRAFTASEHLAKQITAELHRRQTEKNGCCKLQIAAKRLEPS